MRAKTIHPQLLADCHHLGRLSFCELLLNRNARLPWFILVPDTELVDLLDLPVSQRDAVLADCASVSGFIKQVLGYPKVNFAGLGNVVPQMHLHVIGRREGDVCWPQPVWGNLPGGEAYDDARLQNWRRDLERVTGLVPVEPTAGGVAGA
jgi:diadenosine tetraphosphate (Ap4A) HIT family hydrolase